MPVTWSNIECAEEHGTQSENYTSTSFTGSVTVRCAYADRHGLVQDVATNRPQWPYGSIQAWPISAAIKPVAGKFTEDGQACNYTEALVTLAWSSAAEQQLISESIEPTAEFQVLDYRWFRWGSSSGDVLMENEAPGKQIRGLNLIRTYYKVPTISADILDAVGCCNQGAYTSSLLGFTFSDETLLYCPPNLNRTITTSGSQGWDVTMKFRYHPHGWNKYWRSKTQSYQHIYLAGSSSPYKSYPPHAMTGLLA